MLSPAGYQALVSSPQITSKCLEFFIHLLADFNLRQFTYLPIRRIAAVYKVTPRRAVDYLAILLKEGIIEEGLTIKGGDGRRRPTLRVVKKFWAKPGDLARAANQLEREQWMDAITTSSGRPASERPPQSPSPTLDRT